MKLVTADQMRKLEQIAAEELGIPSILLMENAALGIAGHCLNYLKKFDNPKVLVICGSGNNGGDGLALARHLHVKGVETKVVFIGAGSMSEPQPSQPKAGAGSHDATVNLEIIKKLNIPIEYINTSGTGDYNLNLEKFNLVVDAIFGTGLKRDIEDGAKLIIEEINRYAKYIISADMPSGVHSDTGKIMGCAVKANETVTFGFPKKGLYLFPGAGYTGIIRIEDISVPRSLINRIDAKTNILTESEIVIAKQRGEFFPVRKRRSNKGDFGKVLIFAGSEGMPGAAALACSAAYMTGCGLVCACVTQNTAVVIHHWQREVVTRIVPEKNGMYFKGSLADLNEDIKNADVIAIGPGIGRSKDVSMFVYEVIRNAEIPLVLDADALFAVSENINILKELKAPCIITPHPGEMSRLINLSVPEILEDTAAAASGFSKKFNVVTLLKDAHTVIANPNGEININITGNNALSKAGTGDVLTGMIASFIAQGKNVFDAGVLGAYFHGKSCEYACKNKPNCSVTASDIIENIPLSMDNSLNHF